MLTPTQIRRQAIIKELYVSFIGWLWVAATLASVYYLFRAIFLGGPWWYFVCSAIAAYHYIAFLRIIYWKKNESCRRNVRRLPNKYYELN